MERAPLFVVDASVAVKWFVKETLRRKALQVRSDYAEGRIELTAPSLIRYEVGNALRFHPKSTPQLLVESLKALDDMQMIEKGFSMQDVEAASQIAFQERSTFYDAMYLALAESHGGVLLTDDRLFYGKTVKRRRFLQLLQDYGSPHD